jgi:hypothetical protein
MKWKLIEQKHILKGIFVKKKEVLLIDCTEASKGFVFIHNGFIVSTQEIQHKRVQNRYEPLILGSFHPALKMFDQPNHFIHQL